MNEEEKEFWMKIRRALLLFVDAIEELNELDPKTSDLRRLKKRLNCGIIREDELKVKEQ